MEFNNLFFPAPKSAKTDVEDLIFVPKKCGNITIEIPCLFIRYSNHSKILVYFHGNAEDIGNSEGLLRKMSAMFHVSIFFLS
jgi:hypothetical protein